MSETAAGLEVAKRVSQPLLAPTVVDKDLQRGTSQVKKTKAKKLSFRNAKIKLVSCI